MKLKDNTINEVPSIIPSNLWKSLINNINIKSIIDPIPINKNIILQNEIVNSPISIHKNKVSSISNQTKILNLNNNININKISSIPVHTMVTNTDSKYKHYTNHSNSTPLYTSIKNSNQNSLIQDNQSNSLLKTISEDNNLVIALYEFKSKHSDELDIQAGEYLKILNWNYEEGWAYGYKIDNKNKKGIIPKNYIEICSNNEQSI
eukprot:jgi/Orpsp1_1/1192687/evm.model.d7180000095216.1